MRVASFVLSFLFFSSTGLAQQYVRVTADALNVRTVPGGGTIIGQAVRDDVFELRGQRGIWYEINMFSGEYRYIHSNYAAVVASLPPQPAEPIRRLAFQALVRAEDRAFAEADRRIPPTSRAAIERNIDLQRVLDDRYKLKVSHEYQIQPAHYNKLKIEGIRKNWIPSR